MEEYDAYYVHVLQVLIRISVLHYSRAGSSRLGLRTEAYITSDNKQSVNYELQAYKRL